MIITVDGFEIKLVFGDCARYVGPIEILYFEEEDENINKLGRALLFADRLC